MNFDNFNSHDFFDNICLSPTGSESSSNGKSPKYRTHINARERYRTQSVNMAFDTLRDLIPTEPKNRKLSKIEILRLANSYIKHLDAVVVAGNSNQPCSHVYTSSVEGNSPIQRTRICTFCVNSKNLD